MAKIMHFLPTYVYDWIFLNTDVSDFTNNPALAKKKSN